MTAAPWKRTHSCGALDPDAVGAEAVLMGWVDTVRDLGGITFIDLRDREGMTQVVVRPQRGDDVVGPAKRVGTEWVIAVRGKVLERSKETVNPNIATGAVELDAEAIRVLSEAKTPPFEIDDDVKVSEDLRLKYRYLDLRRNRMRQNLATRSRLALAGRRYLEQQGFYEIETPFLTRSTPEGARDYLVPSRVNKGSFYALPQSPQIFKQLLMISGMERYFQVVRCFRDEDLRADRQPEFTQIDIEMSFVEPDDVMGLVEGLFVEMLGAVGIDVEAPFPRMGYGEAIDRYGTDKPDLRFGCEIADLSDVVKGSSYGVFERVLEEGGAVRAIAAPGCARYSRKDIDTIEAFAKGQGAPGLGWARFAEDGIKSPLLKHVGEDRLKAALSKTGGTAGDLLLMVAGVPLEASTVLGALRLELSRREGWLPGGGHQGEWRFLWVTKFPLFDYSKTEDRWTSMHHPFTSPHPEDLDRLESDPGSVRSLAYDVVANGSEVGGGSIRIHRQDVQERVFKALQLSEDEARDKFGFFLEALQYGTPPHGGIALGFDRIAMLAVGGTSLRDVIAFPKTTSAFDLMTGSPSPVTREQLDELGIQIKKAD